MMKEITNRKNYLLTLVSNYGNMLFSMLISFISVPISLNYWKTEKYGIWALITSVVVYLSLTNLGLTQSAGVLIAKTTRIREKLIILERSLKIVLVLTVAGIALYALLNLLYKDWTIVLGKIPATYKNETYMACLVFGLSFFINMPFGLLSSLFQGFQRAYIENIFSMLLVLVNFISLLLVVAFKGSLVFYALSNGAFGLLLNIIKMACFYFLVYKKVKPNSESIVIETKENSYQYIFITGIRFFFIGIGGLLVWYTDNFIISNLIGIKAVTPYSITLRMYQVIFSVTIMINTSFLPLMSREFGKSNWDWINKIYNNFMILIVSLGGLTWLGGVVFLRDVILLWTGKDGYAGLMTVVFLGGYSYLLSTINLNANLINAFNFVHGIAPFFSWFEGVVKLSISVLLIRYFGIAGAAMGTFMGALLVSVWIAPYWLVKSSKTNITFNYKYLLEHFSLVILPCLLLGVFVQLYVGTWYLRLITGMPIVLLYLVGSYLKSPVATKLYFKENIYSLLSKYSALKTA